jgi:predicted nucleic-acid-binding Zn-ribbon protein
MKAKNTKFTTNVIVSAIVTAVMSFIVWLLTWAEIFQMHLLIAIHKCLILSNEILKECREINSAYDKYVKLQHDSMKKVIDSAAEQYERISSQRCKYEEIK